MNALATITAALALCTPALAHADDHVETAKDPSTAFLLSFGGTVASGAVVLAAGQTNNVDLAVGGLLSTLVTPSFGEWYAGQPATIGMGIRAGSLAMILIGARGIACPDTPCNGGSGDADVALLIGGGLGYATGIIYDIAAAPGAARDFNAKHHLQLSPAYVPTAAGRATMGVGIAGAF